MKGVQGQGGGGTAGAVEAVKGTAVPDQGKGVAADRAGARFDDGQGNGGGKGGVDGIAALLENGQTGLGGQGLAGSDHTLLGVNGLAQAGVGGMGVGEVV